MKRTLLAALLVTACGSNPPAEPTEPDLVPLLGIPCTPSQPDECQAPNGVRGRLVCGNDRFGWTCTAYCVSHPCEDPRTACLDRLGLSREAGFPGFCWQRCDPTLPCPAGLACTDLGVCGPAPTASPP